MDIFDAARIGGDIFSWDDFLEQGINRVLHAYPWHNTVFYADADNLVLLPELNNMEQSRTRVSFYGLAGLPVTLGDALSALDEERIEMIRRLLPVIDIHPTELESKSHGKFIQITHLVISRPLGQWSVAGITNLTSAPRKCSIDLQKDLDLPAARYALYDYWNHRFCGIFAESFECKLKPFDTKVFRITPIESGMAALISISRHLTQGGYELTDLKISAKEIAGQTRCVPGESCIITLLLSENCGKIRASHPFTRSGDVVELTLETAHSKTVSWSVMQFSE